VRFLFPVSFCCWLPLFSLPRCVAAVAAGVAQVSFKPAQGIVLRYISEAEAAEFVIPPFEVRSRENVCQFYAVFRYVCTAVLQERRDLYEVISYVNPRRPHSCCVRFRHVVKRVHTFTPLAQSRGPAYASKHCRCPDPQVCRYASALLCPKPPKAANARPGDGGAAVGGAGRRGVGRRQAGQRQRPGELRRVHLLERRAPGGDLQLPSSPKGRWAAAAALLASAQSVCGLPRHEERVGFAAVVWSLLGVAGDDGLAPWENKSTRWGSDIEVGKENSVKYTAPAAGTAETRCDSHRKKIWWDEFRPSLFLTQRVYECACGRRTSAVRYHKVDS